jgi:hypothetical protein
VNGTKVTASVTLAKVTAETVADAKAIRQAISGESTMTLKAGEAGIRSYGFLASVVELTETKAKELVADFGADKGRLSKAGKCVRYVVAEIIAPDTATVETYDDAVEYLVANYASLNAAYSDLFPTDAKETTLADMVANLYKWADKQGISTDDVLLAVVREAEIRKSEGV